MNNEAINKARAVYYGLFSRIFSFVNKEEEYKNIVTTVDILSQNPIDDNSQKALEGMKKFLSDGGFSALQDENNSVFYSPSTSYIPVTASYYDEARDDGKKRLEMINYVLKTKFRRDETKFSEAEDHISFVLGFIQKLIEEDLRNEESNLLISDVFQNILSQTIDDFIQNLHKHESSHFYKDAAIVLKVFIELERVLLDIKKVENKKDLIERAPVKKEKSGFKQRAKRNLDEVTSL